MVYLGLEEECKDHRLCDPSRGKLQVSRDDIFQENIEWRLKAHTSNEGQLQELDILDEFYSNEVIIEKNTGAT